MTYRRRNSLTYAAFLVLPALLLIVGYVYPVADTFTISLHRWDGISPDWTYRGFSGYAELLREPRFINALINNLRWLAFYLVVPTALGLALALLLDKPLRGMSLFKVIFFLPFTMTPVAVAAVWRWLYFPQEGVVTAILNGVGLSFLNQNWLGNPAIVTYSIMGATLWWYSGFAFLIYFAGLRNVPTEYVDAARVDGASAWATFWEVKFPLLWPSTVIILGIAGVEALRTFDLIWGMTHGGPYNSSDVLATLMYKTSFERLEMGQGSAIAVCQMVVSAAVILPYILYMARRVEDIRE